MLWILIKNYELLGELNEFENHEELMRIKVEEERKTIKEILAIKTRWKFVCFHNKKKKVNEVGIDLNVLIMLNSSNFKMYVIKIIYVILKQMNLKVVDGRKRGCESLVSN